MGTPRARIFFLDKLRAFLILLVVLYHVGIVYEASGVGAVFWIVDDPATNDLAGLLNLVIDIFVMPTLFLVSGYFAPSSLENKGGRGFLLSRVRRLLVPWALAVLLLMPLYKILFLASRGLPQEPWWSYFHFSNGILSQSWLWFLPILFLFDLLYWLGSRLGLETPRILPRSAVTGALVIGFGYGLVFDLLDLRGWTKTVLVDFQNERILIYFMAFLLGVLFYRRGVFDHPPKGKAWYHVVNSLAWLPVMGYLVFLLFPWINPGKVLVGEVADRVILWLFFQLSLLCLVYAVIETFRRYGAKPGGKMTTALVKSAYGVYIVHVVVLGGLALLLLELAWPSLLKYLILTFLAYAVSNLLVTGYRNWLGSGASRRRLESS
ncbi:MAG: acyltransferase family protein [Acidobacteriota bacterium]